MRWGGALLVLLASGCASTAGPGLKRSPASPWVLEPGTALHGDRPQVPALAAPTTEPSAVEAVGATASGEPQHAAGPEIDDGLEVPASEAKSAPGAGSGKPSAAAAPRTIALDMSDRDITSRVTSDVASLGPMSVGRTSQGALVNGIAMTDGDAWDVIDGHASYGTQETIDYLTTAIHSVATAFPDSAKMQIGHISAKHGGKLKPHKSHQSGRDVDVSYYYKPDQPFKWYRRATADNLDVARSWAFVRALVTETDVELIFINTSVQKLLKEHALSIGEDAEWVDSIFQYGSKHPWPLVHHAHGHDTHIHVRFYNPQAQEMGRRALDALVDRGLVTPQMYHTRYTVKKGDILGRLAKRFDTTVRKIQEANRLRGTRIQAGMVVVIPRRGQVQTPGLTVIPARRLPPSGSGKPSVSAPAAQSLFR